MTTVDLLVNCQAIGGGYGRKSAHSCGIWQRELSVAMENV
jgi:hypothetical protein